MKLSNTQIRAIAAVLAVLILLGMYSTLFVIIKNKNNNISILKNQVDIKVRKDQRLSSIKQLMADLDKEIKQIDTYFVSKDGVVNFLESLEALRSVSGAYINVNSVSVNDSELNNIPYELLNVEFTARGSWRSIVKLISLIEILPLGVTIERMQLERIPSSSLWKMNTKFIVLKLK